MPSIWNDIVKGCICADYIIWKPEYENELKKIDTVTISQAYFKEKGLSNPQTIQRSLRNLGILSKRVKNLAGQYVYHLDHQCLVDCYTNFTDETVYLNKILRAINQYYIRRYIPLMSRNYGKADIYRDIEDNHGIDVGQFILNIIQLRSNPSQFSVDEIPRLLGFKNEVEFHNEHNELALC